ncbi:claudin-8 [Xenopus laevis]|uniref:Claudin n=2 Tax=Xenopus laevis TaxID=8355 RepID=A0A974DNB2_XENLA|nr:claudin-8 [Xenopus laevis]OCT93846.1 hypothetical protein XELAEV_18011517mg [Xenopus laevis]
MAYFILHILGIVLGAISVLLTIIVTSMAQWRVSYMVEGNSMNCDKRIDGMYLSRWDGLWVTCVSKHIGSMQCNGYDSLVSISTDLKTGRVLMSFAVVISIIAFITAIVAFCFSRCCRGRDGSRYCLFITAGIGFILAAILVLIPISWTTSNIIIAINNHLCKTAQKQEIGEALLLGYPTIVFLLITGAIFCWPYPTHERCNSIESCSDSSLPKPVYVPCQTQDRMPSQAHYSQSQYI